MPQGALSYLILACVHAQSLQSCPTLCNPMDYSLPGLLSMGFSRQEYTGVDCHFLLQGLFPTQGSNSCLQHWQADSLPLSYQGRPFLPLPVSYITRHIPSEPRLDNFSSKRPSLTVQDLMKSPSCVFFQCHHMLFLL